MEIGQKIIRLDVVDSTNNYTANLVKQGQISSGTVILADDQFAGRGQRGAEWSVKPGENLTFSLFLDNVNLSVDRQFVLTQLVSLSLVDVLKAFGLSAIIKWPNDILCNEKKISGVLIENQLSGKIIKSAIIGIGINVNQLEFDGFRATSLKAETHEFRQPMEVLMSFCSAINRRLKSDWMNAEEEYLTNLYRLNQHANYKDSEGMFEGVIEGVTSTGLLIIRKAGTRKEYALKEVEFMP